MKYLDCGAMLSPCRTYRYVLWRIWDESRAAIAFIGLNPSTADETKDDATIRRCVAFADSWGYGGLVMLNLFAFRATDPEAMKAADDPIGPDNDAHLCSQHEMCKMTVAAWGNHGAYRDRSTHVVQMLGNLHCLRTTKAGEPQHPLYLPKSLVPVPLILASHTIADQQGVKA